MKQLILKSITLRNFKGEKNRTTEFNAGTTTIQGDNGLGKSRHADAFFWCFYGKDTQDRKEGVFKSKDANGEDIHHITTEVCVNVEWDGQPYKITRSIEEKWTTPRGCTEARFDGHTTKCSINDVPLSVTEFSKRINDMIPEERFKLLTNPNFFCCNIKPERQRELLFSMAGGVESINSDEFKDLLDRMEGKSVNDYRRELAAKKAAAKKALAEIEPRIDQTEKMRPAAEDWKELEAEVQHYNEQIEGLDAAIGLKVKAEKAAQDKRMEILKEIEAFKAQKIKVKADAESNYIIALNKYNSLCNQLDTEIASARKDIANLTAEDNRLAGFISVEEKDLQMYSNNLTQYRQDYINERNSEYDVNSDICPTCGQLLPQENREQQRIKFNERKANKLESIGELGKGAQKLIDKANERIAEYNKQCEEIKANITLTESRIAELTTQRASLVKPANETDATALPKYIEIEENIAAKQAEFNNTIATADTAGEQEMKRNITEQRDAAIKRLNNKAIIEQCNKEIESLKEQGRGYSYLIAVLQKNEDELMHYSKERVKAVEQRINSLFSGVTFKLFDRTISGDEFECCQALINGVPFAIANNAGRMNAGLNIIDAICKYYEVAAPIWIDNAESNNHIPETIGQKILLKVSDDKTLTIY